MENKATFSEDDQSYAKTELGSTTSDDETKVLGVNWDPESDQFYFDFSKIYEYGKELPITKRSVLKFSAKLFDPIGILSPFVIRLKILFQQLCLEKVDWDEELQGEMRSKFLRTYLNCRHLTKFVSLGVISTVAHKLLVHSCMLSQMPVKWRILTWPI